MPEDPKANPGHEPEPREWDIADSNIGDTSPMEDRVASLIAELEDAKGRSLRIMADFNNYQRRALQNEKLARQDGAAEVIKTVVGAIDHFDIALNADLSKATPDQIVQGVRVIREELLKTLAQHGVSLINPAPGELFEPGRHEAVMQMPKEGIAPGHVVQMFQAGYMLGESRVLRPAKVAVAP
ncbi:MAG: protein GrpE [Phycisphaerae bacterium]|nr:MAG: protein GrpE [Phycisphaerae bacterium]